MLAIEATFLRQDGLGPSTPTGLGIAAHAIFGRAAV
jgi:hypothetical protein